MLGSQLNIITNIQYRELLRLSVNKCNNISCIFKNLISLPLAFSLSDSVVTSEGLLSPGLEDNLHSGKENIETATEKRCITCHLDVCILILPLTVW